MENLKELFLIDPDIIFLNHGSYGATPKPVFSNYQSWQTRLEKQPVLFLGRELDEMLFDAREKLGNYLHASPNDLVFIPNATHGVNIITRSLSLKPGDEILSSDHEYGACEYSWEFVCNQSGAVYKRQKISLPLVSDEQIIEEFWGGVRDRTKIIYLSMSTSPTAIRLPIEKICKRANEYGITTVIDAAHAPGQVEMDLEKMGADIVFGNCHKWMLSPKGAAFLYVRKELQHRIQPLVVSWGSHATNETTTGSKYIDKLQWTGTRDPAASLSVPAAIQFMEEHHWEDVRMKCHEILCNAISTICDLVQMEPLYPLDSRFFVQMGIAPIPVSNLTKLKSLLYDQ
jgi:isopenicillin-N epimerase